MRHKLDAFFSNLAAVYDQIAEKSAVVDMF